ncbi:hypothetical protein BV22DRAFT_867058 [Leucogyrophana mollusca]|uniref:Uncharacterized protein n=1 Tax=Leucogyrophana mollusca TaxID=85980 RepID=A0ACB8B0N2_9AGAM|nr:hypothetical protein BV22DRAFT_867058 [Leucogyrophana mollusca]
MDAHARALVALQIPPCNNPQLLFFSFTYSVGAAIRWGVGCRHWVDQGAGSSGTWSDIVTVSGCGSALHLLDFLASAGAQLSDSVSTVSSQKSYTGSAVPATHSAVPSTYTASSSAPSSMHSRVQLWKGVNIFTCNPYLQPYHAP